MCKYSPNEWHWNIFTISVLSICKRCRFSLFSSAKYRFSWARVAAGAHENLCLLLQGSVLVPQVVTVTGLQTLWLQGHAGSANVSDSPTTEDSLYLVVTKLFSLQHTQAVKFVINSAHQLWHKQKPESPHSSLKLDIILLTFDPDLLMRPQRTK